MESDDRSAVPLGRPRLVVTSSAARCAVVSNAARRATALSKIRRSIMSNKEVSSPNSERIGAGSMSHQAEREIIANI